MDETWLSYTENETWSEAADGVLSHRYEGNMDITNVPRQSADAFAVGGAVSTTEDLAVFMKALSTGTLFQNGIDTLNLMQDYVATPDMPGMEYGLGLMKLDAYETLYGCGNKHKSGTLWGHEGHGGAFAYVWESSNDDDSDDDTEPLVFTGTTNNEKRTYDDFVCKAINLHIKGKLVD